MRLIVAAAVIAIACGGAARAAQPVPYLPVPRGAAVMLNTGSTNSVGYRIVLQASGRTEYVHGADREMVSIDPTLASKFFADASKAMPLSHVRILACMKSASFGSETYVWWRGQRSPDISCPGDDIAMQLNTDVSDIANALKLTGVHAVPMPSNEPRMPLPAATHAPSPLGALLTVRAL